MSRTCGRWLDVGLGWVLLIALFGCRDADEQRRPTLDMQLQAADRTMLAATGTEPVAASPPRVNRQTPTAGVMAADPALAVLAGRQGAEQALAGAKAAETLDAGTVRAPVNDASTKDGTTEPDANTTVSEAPAQACSMATSTLKPGDTTDSIDANGVRRTYVVHVPRTYKGTMPVPLLIDMHGLFGSGQGQLRGSGTAAVADRAGFVAVYPDGIDNAWNVGPCCTQDRGVDDVDFTRALIAKLQMQGCIDRARVYATGVSMGGGMSHYLACEAADVIAAVAPAAFDLLEENTCAPTRPISVMSSRGTADAIVPFAGGASTPPNGVPTTIHFLGAEGTFKEWARINGCTGEPSPAYEGCKSYTQCQGGVEVTLCTEQGGGHTYGDAERAWKMLSKYRLP